MIQLHWRFQRVFILGLAVSNQMNWFHCCLKAVVYSLQMIVIISGETPVLFVDESLTIKNAEQASECRWQLLRKGDRSQGQWKWQRRMALSAVQLQAMQQMKDKAWKTRLEFWRLTCNQGLFNWRIGSAKYHKCSKINQRLHQFRKLRMLNLAWNPKNHLNFHNMKESSVHMVVMNFS